MAKEPKFGVPSMTRRPPRPPSSRIFSHNALRSRMKLRATRPPIEWATRCTGWSRKRVRMRLASASEARSMSLRQSKGNGSTFQRARSRSTARA
jgi:hypothetical protein